MDFKKIKLLPLLLGYFFIESLLVILSPAYGRLIYSLLLLLYFMYEFKKQNITLKNIKELIPKFKDLIKYFFIAISLMLISIFGSLILLSFIYLFISPDIFNSISEASPFTDEMSVWSSFILAVIMAPITEEFVFRGVILNKIGKKYNIYLGIFVSSFIFSILHANVIGMFIFAVVLSVLYIKTKNIVVPITVHFFNNLLAILPTILSNENTSTTTSSEEIAELFTLDVLQGAIILFIIVSLPMVIYLFKNWTYVKSFNYNDEIINLNDSSKDAEWLSLIKIEDNSNLSNIDETKLEFNSNPKKE